MGRWWRLQKKYLHLAGGMAIIAANWAIEVLTRGSKCSVPRVDIEGRLGEGADTAHPTRVWVVAVAAARPVRQTAGLHTAKCGQQLEKRVYSSVG